MTAPVSADVFVEKGVSADDFVNALVAYCNHNEVHNMTEPEFELSRHDFRSFNVTRTLTTLDFDYECGGGFVMFALICIPIPVPASYKFTGHMHVDYPDWGLGKFYRLTIYGLDRKYDNLDRNFTACGFNWILSCKNGGVTRFYANDDEPNRLELRVLPRVL